MSLHNTQTKCVLTNIQSSSKHLSFHKFIKSASIQHQLIIVILITDNKIINLFNDLLKCALMLLKYYLSLSLRISSFTIIEKLNKATQKKVSKKRF